MQKSSKIFVGMDVHKASIDITLAEEGGEVHRFGDVGADRPQSGTSPAHYCSTAPCVAP